MAVPKRKQSHARTGKRRAHQALAAPHLSVCSKCGQPTRPHRVCGYCGHYRGVAVVNLEPEETPVEEKE